MITISATDAKNKIGELWDLADREPVTVERNGKARYMLISIDDYVAVPREEYERTRSNRPAPRFGCAKHLFEGVDTDALLAVDLSDMFRDYI
jgi:PHD/YefM family antitoxin component YafN of YafNO toxin-antitoxin module